MNFTSIISGKKEFATIVLSDTTIDTKIEIFAFGAMLNAFEIVHTGEKLNVIDGYKSVDDAKQNIQSFYKSAKLSPYANRIKNAEYRFGGIPFTLKKYNAGEHALHGLMYDSVFSIVEIANGADYAMVVLQSIYDRKDEGFPFSFRCEVKYKLEKNNLLTITTAITNIDEQLIPVSDGWHPYFTLGDKIDNCQLEFQSKEILEVDENLIPTGKLFPYQEFGSLEFIGNKKFDNCFTVNFAECQPMVVFRNPIKGLQVEIHPSESYPYLQIYTPEHRNSIALENQSAPADSLNNGIGLKVLSPTESATFITKYAVKKVKAVAHNP